MFLRGPPAHVGADLTDEHQRSALINALDGRQVYARDPKQGLARVKAGFVGTPLALPPTVGEHLPSTAIRKSLQMRFNLAITLRNLVVVELIQLHRLLQSKEVLGPPVPLQCARNLPRVMLAVAGPELRQLVGVPLSSQNRLQDSHTGDPRDVAHHMLQL